MASDLAIIYDNAIDRATTIEVTGGTSGTTSPSNLANDIKGKIHRSTSTTTETYGFKWSAVSQTIGAIALPMTNLAADATIRIYLYSDNNYVTNVYDSTLLAGKFTYSDIGIWNGYAGSANANMFGIGRYTCGYVILPSTYTNVKSMKILVNNTNGMLIDCARVVAGPVWRPNRYASNGIQYTIDDTSSPIRTNSGNLLIDRGFQTKTMTFDIKYMEETDRAELIKICKLVGSSKNVFVSIFPSTANRLSDDYSIYGRIVKSPVTYDIYNYYSYNVSIEGW